MSLVRWYEDHWEWGLTEANLIRWYPGPKDRPIIPVNVRVVRLIQTGSGVNMESVSEKFENARIFWLTWANIDLRLWGDAIELLEGEGYDEVTPVDVLDEFWEEGLPYVSVYLVDQFHNNTNLGLTYFAEPAKARSGYGCVVLAAEAWTVLAHELGHAFGLPHLRLESQDHGYNNDVFLDGYTYPAWALRPFPLDLQYDEGLLRGNMMYQWMNNDYKLEDVWLSPSQAERARLTIVSRCCPYATAFDEMIPAGDVAASVLMDDIPAAFISEVIQSEGRARKVSGV